MLPPAFLAPALLRSCATTPPPTQPASCRARTSTDRRRLRRPGRPPPACCTSPPPPPPPPSPLPSALPAALSALAAEVRAAPTGAARYGALIALAAGPAPPPLPHDERTAATLVRGCTSATHLRVRLEGGVVRLAGGSDARVAGGFLALLVRGLDGASPADVLAVSIEAVAEAAGLKVSAAPSRVVGLGTMLHTLQDRVRAAVAGQLVGGCGVGGDAAAACGVEMPRYANVHCGDVAVLLSGGVDSGVAMRLAQESGHRVHPFYLKIWLEDELAHLGDCPWEEDIAWASAVCAQAGVELETVSMQREYWDRVVSYTIDEARAGRTPNPDVMCNTRVKFGAFYDAVGRHFPTIVTGHYAQKAVCAETGLAELRMSPDLVKDQTYFLANLRQEQLSRAEFPVGAFEKQRVRELANEYLLPNRARKDSQGICFLGKLKFDDFLGHHLGTRRGPIVEYETGLALGEHRGFWFYTAGQRKGIGLSGGPWHVVSKDPDANIVFVSRQYRDVAAARTSFEFESASWIAGSWPPELRANGCRASLLVKTRHGPTITECTVTRTGLSSGHVDLGLRDSAQALAPGQFAVLYTRGGVCLGTGRIGSDVRVRENAHALSGVTTSVNLQAHYL